MSCSQDVSDSWTSAAAVLQASNPVLYLACVQAMRSGESWKTMLARLSLPDGTARGIRILETRKNPPPHRRWYNG